MTPITLSVVVAIELIIIIVISRYRGDNRYTKMRTFIILHLTLASLLGSATFSFGSYPVALSGLWMTACLIYGFMVQHQFGTERLRLIVHAGYAAQLFVTAMCFAVVTVTSRSPDPPYVLSADRALSMVAEIQIHSVMSIFTSFLVAITLVNMIWRSTRDRFDHGYLYFLGLIPGVLVYHILSYLSGTFMSTHVVYGAVSALTQYDLVERLAATLLFAFIFLAVMFPAAMICVETARLNQSDKPEIPASENAQ